MVLVILVIQKPPARPVFALKGRAVDGRMTRGRLLEAPDGLRLDLFSPFWLLAAVLDSHPQAGSAASSPFYVATSRWWRYGASSFC